MVSRAARRVRKLKAGGEVTVERADILAMPYADGAFDRVIAEAVTMFVDRPSAARALVRVCKPGGKVLVTEFYWRKPPTQEARRIFMGEVCPGMQFDSLDEWVQIYSEAGLEGVKAVIGPFELMTLRGFLRDEGVWSSLGFAASAMTRPVYLRKLSWLMPRMNRAVPYLGYVLVTGTKPG
jgi:SAM-dependent methyltransferase